MEKIKKLFSYDRSLTSFVNEDGKKITLLSLAVPIFFESVLRILMGTVNSMVLSRYTETAAGAIGTATTILNFLMMLFSMVSTGVTVIIIQNLGAGNRKRAGEAASLSIAFCALMSLLVGGLASGSANWLMGSLMKLEGQQLDEAVKYFRIVAEFNFVSTLIVVLGAITRSYGNTRMTFIVAMIMNGFNAIFSSVVIFRPFEVPLYGIEGVATGRVLAEALALIINIIFMFKLKIDFSFKAIIKPKLDLIKEIIQFGVPSGIGSISYSISTMVSTIFISGFGPVAVSAKAYLSSVTFYSALVGSSMGQATSILVGRNVGRGDMDRAYRLGLQTLKAGIASNVFFAIIMCIFTGPIYRLLFNASDEIINLVQPIMAIDILTEAGRAMNNVEEGALRSSGDVVYQMAIGLSSCWLVSVLFSYIFGVVCGLGLTGCWIAFAMDELTRGMLYFVRWRSKKWMEKRIIRDDELETAPATAIDEAEEQKD
ncbi:MAG: MATE family efflux transporter [Christensenellaceae bacterium]|nr:MATE family efflux transporter [Christensenellaceae bacterium]